MSDSIDLLFLVDILIKPLLAAKFLISLKASIVRSFLLKVFPPIVTSLPLNKSNIKFVASLLSFIDSKPLFTFLANPTFFLSFSIFFWPFTSTFLAFLVVVVLAVVLLTVLFFTNSTPVASKASLWLSKTPKDLPLPSAGL